MTDLSSINPSFSSTAKDFWDRKEGGFAKTVLTVGGIVVLGFAVFFWGLILPFLIGVAGNTIQLAGLIGLLAVATSPWWSDDIGGFCANAFQLSMRWGYQKLIAKDPIGMLRNNVANMRSEAEKFDQGVSQLAGTKQRLETDIQAQFDAIQNDKDMSDAATTKINQLGARRTKVQGNDLQELDLTIQQLSLAKSGYLQSAGISASTIKAEKPMLDQANRMYDQLCRLRNLAQFKVASLSQQADMYSKQREMILSAQKSLSAGRRIIKGDPKQLAVVEQTIEFLNDETARTLGAMKDFNRNSEVYLSDMDLHNDANAAAAQKIFDQMERNLRLPEPVVVQPLGLNQEEVINAPDDFAKLLN